MKYNKYFIIGFTSSTLIALEVVWTRIFSAEFFYTFAFLTLSLAVLCIGLGGLALRFFPILNQRNNLGIILTLSVLLSLIGPPVVVHLGLDFHKLWTSGNTVIKFVFTLFLLGAPFFTGGIALAQLFKLNHRDIPRLYMADLLGAGSGIILAVLFMNWLGTPSATVFICLPMLAAAFIASKRSQRLYPSIATIILLFLAFQANTFLYVPGEQEHLVIYKHWDSMAKIKIYDASPGIRVISIDNIANSPVYRFDGRINRPDSLKYKFGISVKYLIDQFDSCTFMSLGAGGGSDVLQALQEGCTEIHAVEVNPHINWLMQYGELAGYSGNIYRNPRVKVVTEDARSYVQRYKNTFDIIFSIAPVTYAALASGNFALAENYLFTTEAFKDYYRALSDNGFLVMEHQLFLPRVVSQALLALEALGVDNPESHIAIYDLPKRQLKLLLLGEKPLTEEIRQHAFGALTRERDIRLVYPKPESAKDNLFSRIVTEGWEAVANDVPIDISPTDDNRPFVAQIGLWRNLDFSEIEKVQNEPFSGFPMSKLIILVILLIIFILVLPLNFLPYIASGEKLRAVSWLYFFLIGIGFMVVEVVLIQKYTLLMGSSSRTFIIILISLLVSSGIGSRYASKVSDAVPFIGIITWLLLEVFVFKHIPYVFGGLSLFPRMVITILLISPLGFFMGMPFPKGAMRVKSLIDCGFAVNGVASVLGSTAIILVAMTYGFNTALLIAAASYLLALLSLQAKKLW
ncbi:hypothetical protein ACFL1R_11320 [Candidatus Latescibacterota bacterium]